MNLTISAIEGVEKGENKTFSEFPILIGRLPDNDFQLNDKYVSRRHCTIYLDDERFTVSDLKSTNKTILNEKSLESPTYFTDGDKLIIGRNLLVLNYN